MQKFNHRYYQTLLVHASIAYMHVCLYSLERSSSFHRPLMPMRH